MNSLVVRDAQTEDLPFILNSWLSSHAQSRCISPHISVDMYFLLHRPVVEAILHRPTTIVKVAVNAEDPSLIYGYAVFEKPSELINVFHYIYVKRAFSNFGIAKKLMSSAPFAMEKVYTTHVTHRSRQLFEGYDFTYCFYFLYPVKISK